MRVTRKIINLTERPITIKASGNNLIEIEPYPDHELVEFFSKISYKDIFVFNRVGYLITEFGKVDRLERELLSIDNKYIAKLKKLIWNGKNRLNIVIVPFVVGLLLREDKRLSLPEKLSVYVAISENKKNEVKGLINILDLKTPVIEESKGYLF